MTHLIVLLIAVLAAAGLLLWLSHRSAAARRRVSAPKVPTLGPSVPSRAPILVGRPAGGSGGVRAPINPFLGPIDSAGPAASDAIRRAPTLPPLIALEAAPDTSILRGPYMPALDRAPGNEAGTHESPADQTARRNESFA